MSSAQQATTSTKNLMVRRGAVAVLAAGMIVGAGAGTASAKEIGSGTGAGTTTTTCNPVSSLTYKGDFRAGETGLATILVAYGVKPCTNGQAVTVDARMYLTVDPTALSYSDNNAPLDGKFTVFGVKTNTSYTVKITVSDAATGVVVGSKSIFAAAKSKPV